MTMMNTNIKITACWAYVLRSHLKSENKTTILPGDKNHTIEKWNCTHIVIGCVVLLWMIRTLNNVVDAIRETSQRFIRST